MTKRDGLPPKKRGRPPANPDNPKGPGRNAKNRNPGSGKAPYNGPARGDPIGGPANGAGSLAPSRLRLGQISAPRGDDGRFRLSPKGAAGELVAQEAFARDYAIMNDEKAPMLARSDAAARLQNRVWGMPKAPHELTGKDGGPIVAETNERAIAVQAIITKRLGLAKPTDAET